MRNALLVLAVAAMLVAASAGCGTTSSTDKPVAPSTDKAAAKQAGIGDTLAVAGNDTKLEVTVERIKRVKAVVSYGSQVSPAAFGVKLTLKNVGDKLYDDSVSNCLVLVDTKDQTHSPYFGMMTKSGSEMPGQLDQVKIAPGDKRSGWVFFDMSAKTKPRTLQFTADSGFGLEVGEWSLH